MFDIFKKKPKEIVNPNAIYPIEEEIERLLAASWHNYGDRIEILAGPFEEITGLKADESWNHPAAAGSGWSASTGENVNLDRHKLLAMLGKKKPLSEASELLLTSKLNWEYAEIPLADFEKITGIAAKDAESHPAFLSRTLWGEKLDNTILLSMEKLQEHLKTPLAKYAHGWSEAPLENGKFHLPLKKALEMIMHGGDDKVLMSRDNFKRIMRISASEAEKYDACEYNSNKYDLICFDRTKVRIEAGLDQPLEVKQEAVVEAPPKIEINEIKEPENPPVPTTATLSLTKQMVEELLQNGRKEEKDGVGRIVLSFKQVKNITHFSIEQIERLPECMKVDKEHHRLIFWQDRIRDTAKTLGVKI